MVRKEIGERKERQFTLGSVKKDEELMPEVE
jgi:hypothetical protein